ncbi:hypothetical protein M3221_13435 [Domibacillus indicus]|uniref:hypothetical protein n=1 Tax=Domibacillus indicus TaxID=1437523 RepID=UPI00203ED84A|nr:hypothetical protein [Domibacillus indicus]MCM3789403.1 hypothetical protein [Domibacillus indicus]
MLAKIKKVKFEPEHKNPLYTVKLECPLGNELYIKFDYTYAVKAYMPLEVAYNKKRKGAKLAWYTKEVEKMTVEAFLDEIAQKINKKYNFEFSK